MNTQFFRDYESTSNLYEVISRRNKRNPLYLQRLLKRRIKQQRKIKLVIKFKLNSPFKFDKFIILVISIPFSCSDSRNNFILHDVKVHTVEKHNFYSNDFLEVDMKIHKKDISTHLNLVILLNGLCENIPSCLLTDINILDEVKVEKVLHQILFSTVYNNKIDRCILELLPKASNVKLLIDNTQNVFVQNRNKYCPYSLWNSIVNLTSVMTTVPSDSLINSVSVDIKLKWIDSCKKINGSNGLNGYHSSNQNFNFVKIVTHYMYYDEINMCNSAVVDVKNIPQCQWCNFKVLFNNEDLKCIKNRQFERYNEIISIYINHLIHCHIHYKYVLFIDHLNNYHVVVRINNNHRYDEFMTTKKKSLPFIFYGGNIRQKLFNYNEVLSLSELNDFIHNENSESFNLLETEKNGNLISLDEFFIPNKEYYHSRTGLTILDNEYDNDSSEDFDWNIEILNKNIALEEFEDVAFEEKEFMKLWNSHQLLRPVYSDRYILPNIENFVNTFAMEIVQKNLRHQLLIHLINLFEFGLIKDCDIYTLIDIVDDTSKLGSKE